MKMEAVLSSESVELLCYTTPRDTAAEHCVSLLTVVSTLLLSIHVPSHTAYRKTLRYNTNTKCRKSVHTRRPTNLSDCIRSLPKTTYFNTHGRQALKSN
jgi:hypothetical protein